MAARKMIRVKDKWPSSLDFICGHPSITKIKRCMTHIFEFHEEAFPEHALQPSTDLASSHGSEVPDSTVVQKRIGASNKSEMTTPSDVETPDKELPPPGQAHPAFEIISGEKCAPPPRPPIKATNEGVKKLNRCSTKPELVRHPSAARGSQSRNIREDS